MVLTLRRTSHATPGYLCHINISSISCDGKMNLRVLVPCSTEEWVLFEESEFKGSRFKHSLLRHINLHRSSVSVMFSPSCMLGIVLRDISKIPNINYDIMPYQWHRRQYQQLESCSVANGTGATQCMALQGLLQLDKKIP